MNIDQLTDIAKSIRRRVFDFKIMAQAGHLASSLSCVDLLVSLYYDPTTLFNLNEDIIIFSKGHGSPSVYPILADLGIIDSSELQKYCQPDGILKLHADWTIPGCHFVGGSLGNGLGYASGLAYKRDERVYVILGDAELYEGCIWESLIFISHHNIKNLHLLIDRNGMGILGKTEETLKLEPLVDKFVSFGFATEIVDGHDFEQLNFALSRTDDRPLVTIANTIKGKGVSYMEDVWQYHTIIPKEAELIKIGREELR